MESITFWEQSQPGVRFTRREPGTPEFFDEVERYRYELEPHIPEVVRFEEWSDKDVLEVGCGIGTDATRFSAAGARYTGVDQTETAVELARTRFGLRNLAGTFVRAGATELPFASETFDLVYSHGVLHHVDEPDLAVDEIHRVLRPGGTVLVMLYHRASLNYWFNILVIRRGLSAALLVPGVEPLLRRLVVADPAFVSAHRQLLREHGLRYLTDTELFLSKNTDGPRNPLSRVYTRAEARHLFRRFRNVAFDVRFLNLRLYPLCERLAASTAARHLERHIGWHLYVRATRGPASDDVAAATHPGMSGRG